MFLYLVNRDLAGAPSCDRSIQVNLEEALFKQNAYLQTLQAEVEKLKVSCSVLAEANSGYVVANRTSWKDLPCPNWGVILVILNKNQQYLRNSSMRIYGLEVTNVQKKSVIHLLQHVHNVVFEPILQAAMEAREITRCGCFT